MSLDDRIAKLRRERMGRESIVGIGNGNPLPIVREKSLIEQNATWHKRGHFLYICFHNKSKFAPCAACKRSQREANMNYERFVRDVKNAGGIAP